MYMLKKYPQACLLVTRKVKDTIRESCYNDLKWACEKLHLEEEWKFTLSPLQATNVITGQKIFFRGLDDWQKLASIDTGSPNLKLCLWWSEEAFEIEDEDAYRRIDLSIRGKLPDGLHKLIISTCNPWDAEHYLIKDLTNHLEPNEDILREKGKQEKIVIYKTKIKNEETGEDEEFKIKHLYMITNYKLNEFLSKQDIANYEEMERTNYFKYLTEGLGIPSAEQGNIFQEEWFHNTYEDLPRIGWKCISVDATFKKESVNKNGETDYVAIQVWGIGQQDHKFYLISNRRKHLSFTETLEEIEDLMKIYPDTNAILIEDKANGSAIIDVMRKKYNNIIAVQPQGGKESRASAIAPLFEAGSVYLPDKSWLREYINEFVAFPNAPHDDMVDATSQALKRLMDIYIPKDETEEDIRKRQLIDKDYLDTRNALIGDIDFDDALKYYVN